MLAVWLQLTPEQQFLIKDMSDRITIVLIGGAIFVVLVINLLVTVLFKLYIIPTLQLSEETKLISTVNTDYKIPIRGGKEIRDLTEVINQNGDLIQKLKNDTEQEIQAAHQELEQERNRLVALMSELPSGVLVCNLDGRILLYNRRVEQILAREDGKTVDLGLGRSIFKLLNRSPILHALDYLHQRVEEQQIKPISSFVTSYGSKRFFRVHMAPVVHHNSEDRITGFVIVLNDISSKLEAGSRRDRLIESLTEHINGSLKVIRESIMTIRNTPDIEFDRLTKLRKDIDESSLNIENILLKASSSFETHMDSSDTTEDILASDLLKAWSIAVKRKLKTPITVDGGKRRWLNIDCFSVVKGIMFLLSEIHHRCSVESFDLSIKGKDQSNAELKISWTGKTIDQSALDTLEAGLLEGETPDTLVSLKGMFQQYNGKLMLNGDGSAETKCIAFQLPQASPETEWDGHSTGESRPIYYEFDLFNRAGREEHLDDQQLSKLTYVIFDTETTGLNPSKGDEIISIGAIRIVNGKMLHNEVFEQLIDPKRPVPPGSVAVHGIEEKMLKGQPVIDTVLPKLHQFTDGAVLVAHNAAFDMRFLQLKEQQTGIRFTNPVLDTLLLSAVIHPNQDHHGIEDTAHRLGINVIGRHTALGDAIVTAELFLKMIPLLEEKGIHTLQDARMASKKTAYAKVTY